MLKSFPLVEIEKDPDTQKETIKNLNQENLFHIEIQRTQAVLALQKMGKQLNIKFENCNMEQLENLRDYGCRILVLANGVYEENGNLCLHECNGELKRIAPY